jgi:uncharacterized caspase-like protein
MKYAVIIGINNYNDASIQPLQFASRDAEKFYELLTTYADYDKTNCFLFTENALEPIHGMIKTKLDEICKKAVEDENILLYFAGHGQEIEGKSYLIFRDTILSGKPQNALSLEELNHNLHSSKAKFKIRFFDACHSGQKGIRGKENLMTENFFRAITTRLEGFITLASCKQNQYSYEWPEKEHGVFTYFLLEALKGAADSDKDNKVSLHEAYDYVFEKVSTWCSENMVRIKQEPLFSAEYSGLFEFTDLEDKPKIEQTTDFEAKLALEEGTKAEKTVLLDSLIKEIESKGQLTVDKDYKERINNLKQVTQNSLDILGDIAKETINLIHEKVFQIKVEGPIKIQDVPKEIKHKIAKTLKSKYNRDGKLVHPFSYDSYRREVQMAIPLGFPQYKTVWYEDGLEDYISEKGTVIVLVCESTRVYIPSIFYYFYHLTSAYSRLIVIASCYTFLSGEYKEKFDEDSIRIKMLKKPFNLDSWSKDELMHIFREIVEKLVDNLKKLIEDRIKELQKEMIIEE